MTGVTPIPADPALATREVADWLAHYEAGRLGPRAPIAPDIRANLDANDALFRARAQHHAAAIRATRFGAQP